MNREQAEEWTQAQAQVLGGSWRLIELAVDLGVPRALGLSTEAWVRDRLGGYTRLSVKDRRQAVRELTDGGHSQREAARILGVDHHTIQRDTGANAPPAPSEPLRDLPESPGPGANAPPPPQAQNAGDNEWYTPPEIIAAARAVMGTIDLDPATSRTANDQVGAARFYTAEDDGLSYDWAGTVWLNPPYGRGLIEKFCHKLVCEWGADRVLAAIVLVNNATETGWFQHLGGASKALCLPKGRLNFWHPRKISTPLQGQAIMYLGRDGAAFCAEFEQFGSVWIR